MKRIIFVDDEQNILDGLRHLLRKYRREMEMVFVLSGDAALAELRKMPADVIVSDMRMPGMDGATLLGKVKEEFPATVRIILSGHGEKEAIYRALPSAHQFLSKPCDADKLCNVVMRSCQLQTRLTDDSMLKALGRIDRLPSLPAAYWDLVHAFADPDLSTCALAEIVESDSAMCTKILQLVNSSCFGARNGISRIDHAVAYLGVDLIQNLTLSANVFLAMESAPVYPGFSFEALQTHALLTAKVVKGLISDPQQSSDAFTIALLHDIGHTVLASCSPEKFQMVMDSCSHTGRPISEVEKETFGVTHAEAGAYLLGLWGLPYSVIEAVNYHHDPKSAGEHGFELPSAIAVADALVHQALDENPDAPLPTGLEEHLEALGVASNLSKWKEMTFREIHGGKEGN